MMNKTEIRKEEITIKKLKRQLKVFEKVGDSPETVETLKTAIKVRTKRLARKKLELELIEMGTLKKGEMQ